VPKERAKKNLQWDEGWSQVMREGKAGDANSLPLIVDANGATKASHFTMARCGSRRRSSASPSPSCSKCPDPRQDRRRTH
jgi:hypothetical protein